jgi:hypothetical protein
VRRVFPQQQEHYFMTDAIQPVRFRHFKGGEYELVCEATLESDPSVTMIVYKAANGTIWTRPASVFFEQIEHEGVTITRFTRMD